MTEVIEGILAALGLKLKVVAAGAVGAFMSLRFFEGLSLWERWFTFISGLALASYIAVPFAALMGVTTDAMEQGVSLLIGVMGMAIVSAILKVARDTDWAGIIKSRYGK